MHKLDELAMLLEKLGKNEESVGIEVLKTRYKNSYMKLKKQIADTASSAFTEIAASGLYLSDENKAVLDMVLASFKEIMGKEKEKGLSKRLSTILFTEKDLNAFADEALRIRAELINSDAYRMYWLSHCKNMDGGIYNDLIHAWWIDGAWYTDDHTFLSAPPADSSSFDLEYKLEMEAYGKGKGREKAAA